MRLPVALFAMVACLQAFTQASQAETRVALVIGNGAYQNVPRLPNPPNDAADVAAALRHSGFDTILAVNLDRAGMDEATIKFAKAARTVDVALFYYSGHALQFGGVNYLAPIDADLKDEADLRRMTRVDEIVSDLQQAKSLRILVLDSCRDNPLADQLRRSIGSTRALPLQRGLAKIDSPQGMIVAYATQAGRTAEDGDGRNSPYTSSFLNHIEEHEEIGTIFRRVSSEVYEKTRHQQLPELSLSLIGEFYLGGRLELKVPLTTAIDPCAAAGDHWRSAEAIGSVAALEDHLARFPTCAFAGLAKARIESLKSTAAIVVPPVPPAVASRPAPVAPPEPRLQKIIGRWALRRESQPNSRPITSFSVEASGEGIIVLGDSWKGYGNFDGKSGSYHWVFTNGKSGQTTFHMDFDGVLHGQVRGAGIDWDYIATQY